MLACPSCKTRLTRATTAKGTVHLCGRCGGRVVSFTVLRRQADPSFLKLLRLAAYGSRRRGRRPCPHCAGTMREVQVIAGPRPLVLDVCPQCRVVWFDAKEFGQVPPAEPRREPPPPAPADAIELADDGEGRVVPDSTWKYLPAVLGWPVEMGRMPVSRRPVATWMLSAFMAVLFAALALGGGLEDAIRRWGFVPAQWARHSGLTLLTSFFLHAGLFHVIGNLYFFLIFGDNVEDQLGRGRFLALLLLAHLAGVATHAALDPKGAVPVVGASAGISGVLAYYAIAFPHARIGFFIWFLVHWLRVRAIWAFLIYLALQLLGSYKQIGGVVGVSYLAHLGGLAAGAIAAIVFRCTSRPAPPRR